MKPPATDVIIVGSGASAAQAAVALLNAGRTVTMLDVGNRDETYGKIIPPLPFRQVRQTDAGQHRYLLGDEFEGIDLGTVGTAAHVTPPRQYVLRGTDKLLPTVADQFVAAESLALGGLGGAWGAGSFPFTDDELERCGLPVTELRQHYETVAGRIGVSGLSDDDLTEVRGPLKELQPPTELDSNAESILTRYHSRQSAFRQSHTYVGQTLLATLTRPLDNRSANPYHDMDFWSNEGDSGIAPM